MKYCTKCGELKAASEFYKDKKVKDGLQSKCKECRNIAKKEYYRTKKGLVTQIYSSQRQSSRRRKHAMPAYTLKDLRDWLFAQKKFHHLFHLWEVSGYDKMLIPSVDRKDDSEPYNFSNIQLMIWRENKAKGHKDMRSGKLKHGHKPQKAVLQYSKDGELVAEFISVNEAGRQMGVAFQSISQVCNGKRKTAGGFIWQFA